MEQQQGFIGFANIADQVRKKYLVFTTPLSAHLVGAMLY